MLENYFGYEVFRKGLVKYLNTFSYKNAKTQDLWNSVIPKEAISLNISFYINHWIERDGFPYIIVEDLGNSLILTQNRFTSGYSKDDNNWGIPINILWKNGNEVVRSKHFMNEKTLKIPKIGLSYKLNDDSYGFYRVLYSKKHSKQLFKTVLSTANRLNLYSDLFAMAFSNRFPLQDCFDLLKYLGDESNFDVLSVVLNKLTYLKGVFYNSEEKVNFINEKIKSIVKKRFDLIDISAIQPDVNTIEACSLIISIAMDCKFDFALNVMNTLELNQIDPEYHKSYFISQVDNNFKALFDLYKSSTKPNEKRDLLIALGKTNKEENIDFIYNNLAEFEAHSIFCIFIGLGSNLIFRSKIVDLFISNFEILKTHISNPMILRYCAEHALIKGCVENEGKIMQFFEGLKTEPGMAILTGKCSDYIQIANELRRVYGDVSFK
jgi:aminopeptidase N